MASSGVSVIVLVLVSILCGGTLAQSPTSSCTNTLASLAPCLNYVTGNSSTPSPSCCSQLASVVQTSAQCLCQALNSNGASLGFTINRTLALSLPGACQVQTPPISQCQAATAPAPATSPISSPPETSPGSSPAEAPATAPSGASNGTPEPTTKNTPATVATAPATSPTGASNGTPEPTTKNTPATVATAPAASPISSAPKISPDSSPAEATATAPTEASNETPEPTTNNTPATASQVPSPAGTGSNTVPSRTATSNGSIVKAPLHFVLFVFFVVVCGSTVTKF